MPNFTWVCKCGRNLSTNVGRHEFVECSQCGERYSVRRLQNYAQEQNWVHLIDDEGKFVPYLKVEEWGKQQLEQDRWIAHPALAFVGGGIGGVAVNEFRKRQAQRKRQEMEERKPAESLIYPYSNESYKMVCPRCKAQIRSSQESCEKCKGPVEIPIPFQIL